MTTNPNSDRLPDTDHDWVVVLPGPDAQSDTGSDADCPPAEFITARGGVLPAGSRQLLDYLVDNFPAIPDDLRKEMIQSFRVDEYERWVLAPDEKMPQDIIWNGGRWWRRGEFFRRFSFQ